MILFVKIWSNEDDLAQFTFDGGVDGFGGHRSVGCPLSTSYRDQITVWHMDDVVAGQGLGVFFVRVRDKGSNTAPSRQYVSTSH